jgi:hypothetical protein
LPGEIAVGPAAKKYGRFAKLLMFVLRVGMVRDAASSDDLRSPVL